MLFPYKDDNPRILIPYVTYGILIMNLFLFLIQFLISGNNTNVSNKLVYSFGFVPADFNLLTIFSSMFIDSVIIDSKLLAMGMSFYVISG